MYFEGTLMESLVAQVQHFKQWASKYSPDDRYGEWECDYPDWVHLYKAVLDFVATHLSINEWSTEHLHLVLYALARDNECQHIAKQLREYYPGILIQLASLSIKLGEPDAKWQLAKELGQIQLDEVKTETILIELAEDSDEYVRRQALMSLARIKSKFAESLAIKIWHMSHENQEWSRMAVLWCLNKIDSSHFETLRLEAELDSRSYLSEYAKKARQREFEL
jgi:HEAT repeats